MSSRRSRNIPLPPNNSVADITGNGTHDYSLPSGWNDEFSIIGASNILLAMCRRIILMLTIMKYINRQPQRRYGCRPSLHRHRRASGSPLRSRGQIQQSPMAILMRSAIWQHPSVSRSWRMLMSSFPILQLRRIP